ncbi:MraY family glycosyltransferase [Cytophagaceae bacterium ABcell3]|nr:MraY family glycosyltransferase [Cytophagaceae bacterium ABcell3]
MFAIPSIIYVAHVKKLLDKPNLRTIHESLTPRLGGLAIFAGFMSALTIFGEVVEGIQQLLAACLVIFFIGLKDDIITVSAFKKFFVQVLAAGIVMFIADIRITSFQGVLGIYELDHGTSYAFTFLVIIGLTNAVNLIDGLDGLAGTIISIISAMYGIYFLLFGGTDFVPYAYVSFCLLGGIAGFLRYNFYKAIIFMGDTGSLVCGFIIAVLSIQFIEMQAVHNAPAIAMAILFIPILDTLRVFVLRILSGVSPFSPDKNHIHHRLVDMGLTQMGTVGTLSALNIFSISLITYLSHLDGTVLISMLFLLALIVSVIIELFSGTAKFQMK